ncbi:hypothetical protein BDZ88DRAFT_417598 [Geranomyces variabilis]|nr:hypothetical protein BDZ88DRAFT_417598 [Geranomyces variabilis]KAJ3133497.1 hypothetical protein HDU90_005817 [Geranomyces variabilis]
MYAANEVGPIEMNMRTYYRDSTTSEWKSNRLPLGDNPLIQNVVNDFWFIATALICYGVARFIIHFLGRARISLSRPRLVVRPTLGVTRTFARTDIRDCILVDKGLLLLTFSDCTFRRELLGLDDTVDLKQFLSQMHGLYQLWQDVPTIHSHAKLPDSVVLIRFSDPVKFKPIQVQVYGLDPRATHAVISNALDGTPTDIATEIRKCCAVRGNTLLSACRLLSLALERDERSPRSSFSAS